MVLSVLLKASVRFPSVFLLLSHVFKVIHSLKKFLFAPFFSVTLKACEHNNSSGELMLSPQLHRLRLTKRSTRCAYSYPLPAEE